jgi:hypothetical protein
MRDKIPRLVRASVVIVKSGKRTRSLNTRLGAFKLPTGRTREEATAVPFIKKCRRGVGETFSKLAECIMRRHEARAVSAQSALCNTESGGTRITRRFPRDIADGSRYFATRKATFAARSRPSFETRSRDRATIYGIPRMGVYANSRERGLRAGRGGPIRFRGAHLPRYLGYLLILFRAFDDAR